MWMTSYTGSVRGGFGGDFEKVSELSPASEEDSWLSLARRGFFAGATRDGGGGADGKVIIERLFISLPYTETFNSKVIKGFVPELRSRYVFFVFRDSYVLCIYVVNILCKFPNFMYRCITYTMYITFKDKMGIIPIQRKLFFQ